MTPQLQQAIRLLQLSTLELQTEIQDALDSNLMLEVDEEGENSAENAEPADNYTVAEAPPGAETSESASGHEESEPASSGDTNSEIPDDLPVDSSWDDIYDNIAAPLTGSSGESSQDYEISGTTSESLQDYLRWQMELSHFS
ncbi:MAG: RNA polymerase factor sigma-54, partial [Pseudomonadota bacterium]|nr:RNA polymerase factor sigma-54 [Pseudomonadota bacterium]